MLCRRRHRRLSRAFTLVEVVMVVMILGMISSMAIPRLSRGSEAAASAALGGDLAVVRKAILFYAAEHGGVFPGTTEARFIAHLTQYTNASGSVTSTTPGTTTPYGPYLHRVPPCPVGPKVGKTGVLIDAVNSPPRANAAADAGWVYNPNTGEFYANAAGIPQAGATLNAGGEVLDAELG